MKMYRIGAGAGYSGDRIEPAVALAERGALDALVFECLAERTIALAQLRRLRDPQQGYDPLLEARLHAVLPACVRNRVTVISNMGAAHPLAAGAAAIGVARELGLPKLRVAVVTGDDVLPWVRDHDAELIDEGGRRASDLGNRLISANAYLGADALLPALASGADVILTGRVADPALFLAPLMHAFGWRGDDWPMLGRGILVGHLDTGVDGAHPALKGAIKAFAEFDMAGDQVVNADMYDSAWHGTHTAGTIVGRAVRGISFGVAPEALLVSGMVIEGGQVIDRILAGMDWIIAKQARILSLSLGLRDYQPDFEVVIRALRRKGVLPVIAVGNEGPDTSRSPGNYDNVLSVGAIDESRAVAAFSSSRRFPRDSDPLVPDIVGPGVKVLSCAPQERFMESDGTSMATPHIAGLAALLLSAKPSASIDDVERAILASCKSAIDPRANRGLPDGVAALEALLGVAVSIPDPASGSPASRGTPRRVARNGNGRPRAGA